MSQASFESLPRRVQFLMTASRLTAGDREVEYGKPFDNFTNCAGLFTAYITGKYRGISIDEAQFFLTAEDVAWLNVLQKIARTFSGQIKPDTYIDAAAYAAIAGECAEAAKS